MTRLNSFAKLILCVSVSVLSVISKADAPSGGDGADQAELALLMQMLEQETDLATQNRMNADYVPGMMTLLQGQEMQARGFETVAEALNSVAGFYTAVQNDGAPVATVRGVGASLVGNNLKVMLNGLPVNRPIDSAADWVMRMPLRQVERIEVIRGPGAALYGEYAFSGVINIVTREAREVTVTLGHDRLRQMDFLWHEEKESGFKASLNASIRERDESKRLTNPDNFANAGKGYSPGKIDDDEQYGLVMAGLEYDGLEIDLNFAREIRGAWHGKNAAMPREGAPYIENVFSTQVKKLWQVSPSLGIDLRFGFVKTEIDEAEFLPIPMGVDPPGPNTTVEEDRYRQDRNADITRRSALALHWEGWSDHKLFAELSYVKNVTTDSSNFNAVDQGPQIPAGPDFNLVKQGAMQSLKSLTIQDQWSINDSLEITSGLRFDEYSEWGNTLSPRFAAVWRSDDHNLFKFQYAEAFRPPSLANQFPGEQAFPNAQFEPLREESISTTELAYILRGSAFQFRSTLYYSEVKDLIEFFIQPGQPPVWRNRGDIRSYGAELEWQQELTRYLQWDANIAYNDVKDKYDPDDELFGSVVWLGNLSLSLMPTPSVRHAISLHYTGEQEGSDRLRFKPNQEFKPYTTINYSAQLDQLAGVDSLSASFGIQNLSNKHYNTVANPTQYPDGLTGEARRFWLALSYEY